MYKIKHVKRPSAQMGTLKINVLGIYIISSNLQTTVLGVNYKALKYQS